MAILPGMTAYAYDHSNKEVQAGDAKSPRSAYAVGAG